MFDIKIDTENIINIFNDNSTNYIVFDLNKNSIIEFNNTIVTPLNEYFLSSELYEMYIEFENILNDIV